jgi:tRNA(fMet)-specific endonuclease VapC
MKYLLDTDTCIYLLKGLIKNAEEQFEALKPGDVAIATITLAELLFGAEKSRHVEQNKQTIENFIRPLVLLSFDANAAKQYGYIRYKLEQSGRIIGSMDMLIAAIALANDVKLVTNNLKEFNRVNGLKTENWFKTK